MSVFLSRFTPSLLSPEALEAIFVQRERLASNLVDRIQSSALTPSKHYSLVIGPRGIGKTHLVSLVYHRVKRHGQLSDRLLCAWLREEEWGITSYLDLLLSILRALAQDLQDPQIDTEYQRLFELDSEKAEQAAKQLLLNIVDGRTLLVIAENLDEIFEGMGEDGQQKLRAYIQNHPFWTILGTSQSLFGGVSLQDSPFYGFFEVTHLQELSFKDAEELLIKIAQYHGNQDLARDLHTTLGRSRIRAVHHLAAGNPRVYVILSQFLTSSSLDELVEPLLQTFDDLTPYYQARMSYLSPQQRKLVEFLCEQRGAVPVKEIAKRNFLTHATTSGQLKKLREFGYVRPERIGKESLFELREPLMRLSLEVKRQRGKPIRLLLNFLRMWFSREELRKRLDDLEEGSIGKGDIVRTMESYGDDSVDPRVQACMKDYARYIAIDDFDRALQVAEELIEIRGFTSDWIRRSECLERMGRGDLAERVKRQALDLKVLGVEALLDRARMLLHVEHYDELVNFTEQVLKDNPHSAELWLCRADGLRLIGRHEEALESYERSVELNPDDSVAWNNRGVELRRTQRREDALASYDRALEITEDLHAALRNRATALEDLGRLGEALAAIDRLLEFYPGNDFALKRKYQLHTQLGQEEEALRFFERLARSDPENGLVWLIKGAILVSRADYVEAQKLLRRATELSPKNAWAWAELAACLDLLGRFREALDAAERASKLNSSSAGIWFLTGLCQYRRGRLEDSLVSMDRALAIEPEYSSALYNRPIALSSLGRHEDALAAFNLAIERLEGSTDFHIESNRAVILMLLGHWEDGRKALDDALERSSAEEIKDRGEIAIVRNMLIRTQREETWRRHIAIWIEVFEHHERLTLLGQGLVRTIRTLSIPWISAEVARAWNSVWQDLGKDKSDLTISLRLFDAAVHYRESGDKRVLLSLPAEERALLTPLLEEG